MRAFSSLIVAAGLVIISTTACKKTVEPLDYSKEYASFDLVVDTTSSTGEILIGSRDVQTDITNELAAKGFTVNNLKSVRVNEIKIETTEAGKTLDYFRKIDVRLNNQGAGNVIFASKELGETYTMTSVVFNDEGIELKEFFKQGEMQFNIYGINDLIIQQPLSLRVSMSFTVNAKLGN
jgi:hypothetical protein